MKTIFTILALLTAIETAPAQVTQEWIARYNGPGNSNDRATSIVVDGSGNIYVTGTSRESGTGDDYSTIKYNSSGVQQWVRRYNGSGDSTDQATSIAIDVSGNVYLTGLSTGSGKGYDYATIKYNSSGDLVWVKRYNGPGNSFDVATSIAVDGTGNVYVTGYSNDNSDSLSSTGLDYSTIKYNSSGDSVWVKRYNGTGNFEDIATSIEVDGLGNVYITGYTGSEPTRDFVTIKYNSSGDSVWVKRYNGPGNSDDKAYSIAVDVLGNVYVTGSSTGSGTFTDYATIKYSQSTGIRQISSSIPEEYSLSQNFPNPFNPVTNLEFGISDLGFVSLKVYDILGKEIITLVNEKLSPGNYKVEFDGSGLASGVYFYMLTAGEFTDTKRMMLVK